MSKPAPNAATDNPTLIRELTRVQAVFQLRAIMAAMGLHHHHHEKGSPMTDNTPELLPSKADRATLDALRRASILYSGDRNALTHAQLTILARHRIAAEQSTSPSGLVEAGCVWLRERAAACKDEAVNRFERDDEEAGEEWRVRGETYGFVADQIECGYTPFTTNCGDPGVPLCSACSQPITELTQQPGCGATLAPPTTDARTPEVEDERIWQPIGTAPKGATDVLLLFPNGRQAVGWRHSAGYCLDAKARPFAQEPTHWMPLPPPLTPTTEQEKPDA